MSNQQAIVIVLICILVKENLMERCSPTEHTPNNENALNSVKVDLTRPSLKIETLRATQNVITDL